MNRGRLSLIAIGAAAAALALTGCQKPGPGASVFSGTTTAHSQAACWAFDASSVDADACAQEVLAKATAGEAVSSVPVIPGDVIGVSVEPVVADAGWTIRVGGQAVTQTPLTTTYFRFTFPEFQQVPADGLSMEIVAGDDAGTKGVWLFQLKAA
jgi:hypothetical protein